MPPLQSLPTPERVIVVGAGMVGLATAWFLRQRGLEVTVVERDHVAAGASWGNAGWLTPGIATPLPEPAVLKYGIKALVDPASPLYVPPRANLHLARFMVGFAAHSTARRWSRAMGHLIGVNDLALDSFDQLAAGGVMAPTQPAKTFVAAYRSSAARSVLLEEIEQIHAAGQSIDFDTVDGDQARELEPVLSDEVAAAILLHDQRFINPGEYLAALAESARELGVEIVEGVDVRDLADRGDRVDVACSDGSVRSSDAVVVASGAHLNQLVREFGVKRVVQAGRGYSFSVPVEHLPSGPVYLPEQRVACTPLGDRLRVAGMMEFRRPEEALDRRRIDAIVAAARPMLVGVDLADRQDEWVGSRPCTTDGLPLVGVTGSPRIFAAGGHGMWGITLGPVTGRLLAEQIVTGRVPEQLQPFAPLR